MPITAERVITIIDTASECYRGVSRLREVTRKIHDDMERLLSRRDIPNDVLDHLHIIKTLASIGYQFEIPADVVENLFYEKARFEFNEKKNRHARDRMRTLRNGVTKDRTIETSETRKLPFQERMKSFRTSRIAIAEAEDIEWFRVQGQKYHPQRGPCEGEPCKICEELEVGAFAKEKVTESREDQTSSYPHPGQAPDGLEDEDPLGEN